MAHGRRAVASSRLHNNKPQHRGRRPGGGSQLGLQQSSQQQWPATFWPAGRAAWRAVAYKAGLWPGAAAD